jgi:hypothetical protein
MMAVSIGVRSPQDPNAEALAKLAGESDQRTVMEDGHLLV